MHQDILEYSDGDQKLIGQLIYKDKAAKNQPAIIVFPAFEGLSEFAINYAKQLADKGYVVFAADMYGDGKTSETIDGCIELITPFLKDRSLVRRRALLAHETLSKIDFIDNTKIGAIGFCFGGMCVLEAVRAGANIKAAVTAHGVLAKSDLPTEKISSSILILHGFKDPQVPPDSLKTFADEMEAENVDDWTFTFFGNGKHSFTDPKTGSFDAAKEKEMGREYNPIAAERTFRYAVDFFDELL